MKPFRADCAALPKRVLLVWPSTGHSGVYFRTGVGGPGNGAVLSRRDVRRLATALTKWLSVKPKKRKGTR